MIKQLFTPNTEHITNFYEKSKFILAWRLCLLFGAVFLTLTIVFSTSSIKELLVYAGCTLISILSLFYLNKNGKSQFIYFFLSITGTVIAAYTMNFFVDVVHFGDILWIILVIIFAFFGLGIKYGLVFLGINLCNIIYFSIFSVNTNIEELVQLNNVSQVSLAIELVSATVSISYVIYQFVIFHNYTYGQLSRANEELQLRNDVISNQNIEKTTLVQEVHHRVKNNLQIIISLLRLQKKVIKSEEAQKQFNEAINRIMVMSSIHKKLYKDKSFTQIVPKDYFTELTNDIKLLSSNSRDIEISIESDIDNIGLKTIVPLGLIVNELVSNSIQHGFKESKEGIIQIKMFDTMSNDFNFSYNDNGTWLEPTEDYSSFGLELIEILTAQLDGEHSRTINSKGTEYTFKLKKLD